MSSFQTTLYDQLLKLVETSESFYYQDFSLGEYVFRIFNYRLASYSDFLLPGAIECRGVMFDVTNEDAPTMSALPMEKFFNLYENPLTMDLDMSTAVAIELKADGSLISSYMVGETIRLKSKGSIGSDQAIDAMKWLSRQEHIVLHEALWELTAKGITVNAEWCAPFNRIVISYQKPTLTILNLRSMETGEYVTKEQAIAVIGSKYASVLDDHWVDVVDTNGLDIVDFVNNIPDMVDVEGYIVKLNTGQAVKIKTHWYLVQHRAKDSINSDRRLFETVIMDAQDDLRSMFHDDEWVIKRIQWMEDLVVAEYNHMVATVEDFYDNNKHLERKDYAIKAQAEVKRLWFGLVMNLYLGKPNDYRVFMMSKWKEYGIKDQLERTE